MKAQLREEAGKKRKNESKSSYLKSLESLKIYPEGKNHHPLMASQDQTKNILGERHITDGTLRSETY